ncbi:unnamed protein product [Clonostachys byssicola]|uniref:Uncharacterized protein n=1 Tax=Clonostachys byssicola TaxID=160290 RepID=A0A9N9UFR5_9HYPO|nr:unnamed protein product [Clonostachys byssicola]
MTDITSTFTPPTPYRARGVARRRPISKSHPRESPQFFSSNPTSLGDLDVLPSHGGKVALTSLHANPAGILDSHLPICYFLPGTHGRSHHELGWTAPVPVVDTRNSRPIGPPAPKEGGVCARLAWHRRSVVMDMATLDPTFLTPA